MPPRLTVREVIRILEADGWHHVATRVAIASLGMMRKPAALPWPESFQRKSPGTLNSILKQAGLKEW
jgi:predicted RNA binding protein YcfA (HicA-like mRNA interferase family)